MRVDTDTIGERIAEQVAHMDAAMHGLLTDLRAFDQAGGWYRQGFQTCASWLSWRVGWTLGTAREHVRVASKLADLSHIDEALRQGEISYSKVRAMTRVATPANELTLLEEARYTTGQQLEVICRKYALVQRHDQESNERDDSERRYVTRRDSPDGMVRIVAALHPEEAAMVWTALERVMKAGCRGRAAVASTPSSNHGASHLPAESSGAAGSKGATRSDDSVDSAHFTANDHQSGVPAESSGAAGSNGATRSDDSARVTDNDRQSRVPAETSGGRSSSHSETQSARVPRFTRADALIVMAEEVIRGTRPNRSPVELVVTVAAEHLHLAAGAVSPTAGANLLESAGDQGRDSDPSIVACFADGTAVSMTVARRLACDAGIAPMVEGPDGAPLALGRKTRAIPASMKRALLRRDGGCRFPGCSNRLCVEGHHVKHWADGGETEIENLLSLCSHHHRFVHEYGFAVEWIGTTEVRFIDPDGRTVVPVPEPARPARLGWETIRRRNTVLGITPETAACGWDGARIDLAACIHELVRADERAICVP